MWVKAVGGALVMLGGAMTSLILNRAASDKLSRLDALLSLLSYIRSQIDLFCLPIGEILKRADPELLLRCGAPESANGFGELISELEPRPDDEVMKLLAAFESTLGELYREEQLKSLDYYISELSALRDRLSGELGKRRRLNRTLCLSAAAAIVILFI